MATNIPHGSVPSQSFNRLFNNLSPLIATQKDLEILANTMLDPVARGPIQGSLLPAGYTYFGQFIDHDITHDSTTTLTNPANLNTLVNDQTSFFDLSCLYGVNNNLLDTNGLFTIGKNANGEDDLPRNPNGVAIIGDPRNEENLIIAQLQLSFLKFHNRVITDIKLSNPSFTISQAIAEARKIVTWHYQWLVVENFLRDLCGPYFSRLFDANGKPQIHPAFQAIYPNIPIEFTGAAYRMGHSMVRESYYLNSNFDVFPIFSPTLPAPLISIPDLRGFRELPPNFTIDWSVFFPMPFHKGYQVTENLDVFVTQSLFNLPMPVVVADQPNILPLRNLMRGTFTYELPSGQDLASALGIPSNEIMKVSTGNLVFQTQNIPSVMQPLLSVTDLLHLTNVFGEQTPLFYYCLLDNHLGGGGNHLGPLTSAIVGQTFLCLLANDPTSYLNNNFIPTAGQFGCVTTGTYRFAEFFTYALGLKAFSPTDIIPDSNTNFFDPFSTLINTISPIGHSLQLSLAIPGVAPDIVVAKFPGMTIGQYDPTLVLPINTTQSEINQVATNAVKFAVDATLAVVRFINNRNILGTAQGLILPLPPNAPKAGVVPPNVAPVLPVVPPTNMSADQKRALAIFTEIDNATFMLKHQAILDSQRAANEINQALFGLVAPPIVLVI